MKEILLVRFLNSVGVFNWLRWFRSRLQIFDKHKLSFYRQFIKKEDLCFDIGANIGQEVEIFLKLGAKVIAVEPQQSCFSFLKKIYGKNKRVVLVNKALDSNTGTKELLICESNAMSSLSLDWVLKAKDLFKDHEWKGKETVHVETLDALIEHFGTPQFVKIDVEGFELEVIKGLNRKIPYLCFELSPITTFRLIEIRDHLKKIGEVSFNLVGGPIFSKGPIHFIFNEWVEWEELSKYVSDNKENIFADVFVKFH